MRTEWTRWARAALGALIVTGAGGCAAEAGMAPAPDVNAAQKSVVLEPEPATIEEAQAQLDRARGQLGGPGWAGGGAGGPGATGGATSAPTTTAAPTMRTETPPPAASATGGDESQRRAACVTPCHAIASMRRAVEAICRMAGAQDARCTDARKTLGESEAKTAGCGC